MKPAFVETVQISCKFRRHLTSQGDTVVGCIRNGFAAAGLATKFNMSFDTIKNALKGFAGLTGCGGIADVKFIAVPRQKINDSVDRVKKYSPVSKERLKIENEPLYLRLKTEGIYYE